MAKGEIARFVELNILEADTYSTNLKRFLARMFFEEKKSSYCDSLGGSCLPCRQNILTLSYNSKTVTHI